MRAGQYGGGKVKSAGLASLKETFSGVLEVARRLLCGKGCLRAAAKL